VKIHGFCTLNLYLKIPVLIGNIALDPNPFNRPPGAYFSGILRKENPKLDIKI